MSTTASPTTAKPVRGRVTNVEVTIEYGVPGDPSAFSVKTSIDINKYIALFWRHPKNVDSPSDPDGVEVKDSILGKFYGDVGLTPPDVKDEHGNVIKSSADIINECRSRNGGHSAPKPDPLKHDDIKNAWNSSKLIYILNANSSGTTTLSTPKVVLPGLIAKGRPCDFDSIV